MQTKSLDPFQTAQTVVSRSEIDEILKRVLEGANDELSNSVLQTIPQIAQTLGVSEARIQELLADIRAPSRAETEG